MRASLLARRRTATLTTVLRIAAAVVPVIVLLRRTDVRQALGLISGAKLEFLLAAAFVMSIPMAMGASRWRLLLRSQGLTLPYQFVLRVHLAGYALSTVLPTSLGGDLLRAGTQPERNGRGCGGHRPSGQEARCQRVVDIAE